MNIMPKKTLVIVLALAACTLSAARAQKDPMLQELARKVAEDTGLDWRTIPRGAPVEIPSESRPTRAVPQDLRAASGPATMPPAPGEPSDRDVAATAYRAAMLTARQLIELDGRQEAYRVGLYDGLHTALGDSNLGGREYHSGLEDGRRSPDAHLRGSGIGGSAARSAAQRAAYENVSAQFHDLTVEPQPWPHAQAPPFGVPIQESAPPGLEEIFRGYPIHDFLRVRYVEPLPDPWQTYRHGSYRDLYTPCWRNAHQAFEYWVQHHPADRQPYFKAVFLFFYPREAAAISAGILDEAFSRGFNDGWGYGAYIHARRSYLGGYHQGWYETLRRSTEEAYRHGFEQTYAARYSEYFHDWSTSPRPEILAVRMNDGNDDGVFEPGETLDVEYELVNYGGAPGSFTVRLDSQVLRQGVSEPVELPRRTVRRAAAPFTVEIDPAVRPRTQSALAFSVAGLEQRLPLKVSYPLELHRQIRLLDHDAVEGRAVVEAEVHNMSRRAVAGEIGLSGAAAPLPEPFAEIAAGGHRRFSLTLAGLAPLDLLGGAVEVEFFVKSSGKVHDEHAERLPELAVDLDNRELLRYMRHLARATAPAPAEAGGAQELMLRRLRVDWKAAVAAKGNPYKRDLKNGTRETALGDLVSTYSTQRHTFVHREVFTALGPRIEALAKSMRGNHPFLRRSMKKLAQTLAGGRTRNVAVPLRIASSEPLVESSGVMLYEHAHFRGRSESFAISDARLRDNGIGNDRASSIKVAPGCTVTLYEHDGYRGRSTVLSEDSADLRHTAVGTDELSSLEIRCGDMLNG